jgi:hypothetical protein|tara:strand:+ start:40 stop:420 length:381 start_codon:yes stop_codon:yes gene_type:complete
VELPTITIPEPIIVDTVSIPLPTADVPSYKMMIVPPSDLERPKDTEEIKTETPEPPKLEIPVIDIQLPLPTAEVVATATYAAVAAVATTTLATPFFDQIKKKLQKFIQGKINKWKENHLKKKEKKD